MLEIKLLAEEMKDELCSAKKYAMCYQKEKENNPVTAKKYLEMAQDEIKHAEYLHDIAVEKIENVGENVEVPEFMRILWNDEHEKYIDKMAQIKVMLSM